MIRAVIVEDEKNNWERLSRLLERKAPDVEVTGIASSVEDALPLLRELKPDLVFMDIELPDGTGFEILEELTDLAFEVIFATAYDQYAIKAIRFAAADYLLKPVEADELVNALDRTRTRMTSNKEKTSQIVNQTFQSEKPDQLALPTLEGYSIVKLEDIIRCEADGNYTRFHLSGQRNILVSKTLKEYDELLTNQGFCRVHHKHLVNLNHCTKYIKGDGGLITMSDGVDVEVSKRKKENFLTLLKKS